MGVLSACNKARAPSLNSYVLLNTSPHSLCNTEWQNHVDALSTVEEAEVFSFSVCQPFFKINTFSQDDEHVNRMDVSHLNCITYLGCKYSYTVNLFYPDMFVHLLVSHCL